ncbi:MAG: hypothetical protein GXO10_07790 [Crenarchaeota archaeon]|nr:hypothetical protein [Thermoproteota archaeon]
MTYHLILIYVSVPEEYEDEVLEEAEKYIEELGLRITRGVIITWRSREEIEKRMLKVKDVIIRRLEEGFEGIEFLYSIIELSEDQYKNVRNLVIKKLEILCTSLINKVEKLVEDVKSCKGREVRKYRKVLQEIEESFRKIAEFHKVFDVRHSIFDKLNRAMSELRAEFYRRLK